MTEGNQAEEPTENSVEELPNNKQKEVEAEPAVNDDGALKPPSSDQEELQKDDGAEFKMRPVNVELDETKGFSFRTLLRFLGPGFFVSVGYMDPGNWATDIEGGASFGYKLIWVLLLSNLIAFLLQTLAARVGIVAEQDLAQLCRTQYNKPVCYALWVLCEIAIIAMDLAEVLGTAVGLELLLGIPVIAGVVITAFDTLLFLVIQRFGIRKLEVIIFLLLGTVTSCFIVELFIVRPNFGDIMKGFIPTIGGDSVFIAMGMLGATVMPHNFYLHSSVVQSRKFGRSTKQLKQACFYNLLDIGIALNIAFFVNASILVVAAAAFYTRGIEVTEIEDAHRLLGDVMHSEAAPRVFGLGLLCSGQSSTVTGTMAGQVVMEGFVQLRIRPWIRRLVTRLAAIIPATVVILAMGNSGTYKLLILSQVILSVQLPFAIVPLIKFSSDRKLMGTFQTAMWARALAWLSSAMIIGLNIWVISDTIKDLMMLNTAGLVCAFIFVIPIALSLLALLAFLAFRGFNPYKFRNSLTGSSYTFADADSKHSGGDDEEAQLEEQRTEMIQSNHALAPANHHHRDRCGRSASDP